MEKRKLTYFQHKYLCRVLKFKWIFGFVSYFPCVLYVSTSNRELLELWYAEPDSAEADWDPPWLSFHRLSESVSAAHASATTHSLRSGLAVLTRTSRTADASAGSFKSFCQVIKKIERYTYRDLQLY